MKKIKSVELHNFQSHEHTVLNFSRFVAIVGPSNNGKTSIIRGLEWGLYNRPSGSDFIRTGENECWVTINFDNGTMIKRFKTADGKENYYEMKDSADGDVVRLEKFGSGTVSAVEELHQMFEVDFINDKKSLNLCSQLEPPFLISESSSIKTYIIGKTANVDVIDNASKNTGSDLLAEKKEEKRLKEKVKQLEQDISSLPDTDKMKNDLDHLSEIHIKIKELSESSDILKSLFSKFKEVRVRLDEAVKITSIEQEVEDVLRKLDNAVSLIIKLKSLRAVVDRQDGIKSRIDSCDKQLKMVSEQVIDKLISIILVVEKNIEHHKAINNCGRKVTDLEKNINITNIVISNEDSVKKATVVLEEYLPGKISSYAGISKLQEKIRCANQLVSLEDEKISGLEETLDGIKNSYAEVLNDHKICPVCYNNITEKDIKKIMKEV